MKEPTMIRIFAFALSGIALVALASPQASAMPVSGLREAAPADVTQVYHRGKPHYRRYPPRVRVYPRYYAAPAYGTSYYYDDLSQYPYSRGFGDRNPVPRGNMRGCTIDL